MRFFAFLLLFMVVFIGGAHSISCLSDLCDPSCREQGCSHGNCEMRRGMLRCVCSGLKCGD
ncbi:hypothetical protein OESDEN_12560 [Oesophagostomum dentatum]|uniref:Uncharacterized protein n=1 Tax=Oesophagostomum dentatum TaxID=61180 RepID=A0A0B1SWZ1_OESDE|nr:hypothetical protein OESDEN_12560 [Oesophagostomum dentatum]